MKLSLVAGAATKPACDCLLIPVFESDLGDSANQPPALAAANESLDGRLLKTAADENFKGKAEQSFLLHTHGGLAAGRVLLLGLGPRQRFDLEVLRMALGRGVKTALRLNAGTLAVALPALEEAAAGIRAAAEGLLLGAYKFDRYKTGDQERKPARLKETRLILPEGQARSRPLQQALDLGVLVAEATNWARDLVNEPPNALTPTRLAAIAREVAKESGLKIEVLDRTGIKRLKMGMFLGVAQGSSEAPALIHLTWQPSGKNARKPPLALVGKAITFDSGGLSLKPSDSMKDMKTDMAGAASVLGAMKVIARLAPPFPVHAFMGACENMPGGRAYKLGDVLTSRRGKTVEITNTDAEGRLVLGDVLTLAAELEPAAIIDLATLTGACMVALGHNTTGVFGVDDAVVGEVLEAASAAGEDMWRLPVSEHQRDSLKSDIADLKNSGERWGGASAAALFLKEFVGETPWVHLDIAGPSTSPKERGYFTKGGTGVGLRTLVELVLQRSRR